MAEKAAEKGAQKARKWRRRELVGLVLLGVGLMIFFALVSYAPSDPSFNSAGRGSVRNWIGPVGAHVADVAHQLFGYGAYGIAWIPVAFGVAVLVGRDLRHVFLRLLAFVLLAVSGAALAQFVMAGAAGGLVGRLLVDRLATAIGQAGAAIGVIVMFIALVVVTLNVSFVRVTAAVSDMSGRLSKLGLSLLGLLWSRASAALGRWRKERTLARKARGQRAKQAKPEATSESRAESKPKRGKVLPAPLPLDDEPQPLGENLSSAARRDPDGPGEFGEWPNDPDVLASPHKEDDWQSGADNADLVMRAASGPLIVDPRPDAKAGGRKLKAVQGAFEFLDAAAPFKLPPASLLDYDAPERVPIDSEKLLQNAKKLERKLKDYGIDGSVVEIRPGPVVTMYEFLPAPGVKVSKISSLSDDLAMAMEAMRVRIVAPIPGKGVVGIEIPNDSRETVYLKEIISHDDFLSSASKLTLAIGKDIEGKPYVSDLARCPHLLVAGATGTGKSVSINGIILSLLYRATPDEVRLIMVDPKMLELSIYEGIPHLLLPVVTDPKKASLALRWAVEEMERRYALLSEAGVRNISGYNKKLEKQLAEASAEVPPGLDENGQPIEGAAPKPKKLPYIVVLIDELADLMMVASREVETSICRLAQMARAAGIHLILATQRPSVDVLTGVIKANFPARISFQVTSRHDSRTILDNIGAENLLGMGDMLMMPPGTGGIERVHGAFVSEVEIQRVVDFLKQQGKPSYDESILRPREDEEDSGAGQDEYEDELYDQAVAFVAEQRQASVSMLQRRMRIGYNRSARLIERMEREGVVGPGDGAKPRDVLVHRSDAVQPL